MSLDLLQSLSSEKVDERVESAIIIGESATYGGLANSAKYIRPLLDRISLEANRDVRRYLLFALFQIAMNGMPGDSNLDAIVRLLPSLDVGTFEYAIAILAFSHNPAYREVIERYLDHENKVIHDSAVEALRELRGR